MIKCFAYQIDEGNIYIPPSLTLIGEIKRFYPDKALVAEITDSNWSGLAEEIEEFAVENEIVQRLPLNFSLGYYNESKNKWIEFNETEIPLDEILVYITDDKKPSKEIPVLYEAYPNATTPTVEILGRITKVDEKHVWFEQDSSLEKKAEEELSKVYNAVIFGNLDENVNACVPRVQIGKSYFVLWVD